MAAVWLNDRLVTAEQARIDPADRGLLLADGVFETIRARAGAPCHLDRHLRRLHAGAAVLGFDLPPEPRLVAAIEAVLGAWHRPEAALRLTVTRGPGPRGLTPPTDARPTLLVTAAPLPAPPAPARLVTSPVRRNERSPASRIKSLAYLDNVLALRAAHAAGADDALLLNTVGRAACASAANLFAVLDGTLVTPPIDDGALAGVTRGLLLEREGAVERPIARTDLARADELFLTSALVGIRPVVALDGRTLPQGAVAGVLAGRL